VPDEEHAFALPRRTALMPRDQMTRAPDLRHRHPLDLETERLELRAHDFSDLLHPFGVERAAVDVHQFLEELDGARRFGISCLHDTLLCGRELRGMRRGDETGE